MMLLIDGDHIIFPVIITLVKISGINRAVCHMGIYYHSFNMVRGFL